MASHVGFIGGSQTDGMSPRRLTSRQLVQMYLARIGMYQQTLKAAVYDAHALNADDENDIAQNLVDQM
jgi:hypothetical protein